jgi:transcriptional regulator with GAF, ATPase, and Fis domain
MTYEKDLTGNGITSINWYPTSMFQPTDAPGDVLRQRRSSPGPAPDSAARLTASFELMAAILAETDLVDVLTLIVRRARHIGDADLAFIALPGAVQHTLEIHVAIGANADLIRGRAVRAGTSVIGKVFRTGRAMATQVAADPPLRGLPAGPILLVPLDTGERTCGVLALAGRPRDLPFNPSVKRQLLIFATTSAAMIEIAEERRGYIA